MYNIIHIQCNFHTQHTYVHTAQDQKEQIISPQVPIDNRQNDCVFLVTLVTLVFLPLPIYKEELISTLEDGLSNISHFKVDYQRNKHNLHTDREMLALKFQIM